VGGVEDIAGTVLRLIAIPCKVWDKWDGYVGRNNPNITSPHSGATGKTIVTTTIKKG
jgi:hypothetical protein